MASRVHVRKNTLSQIADGRYIAWPSVELYLRSIETFGRVVSNEDRARADELWRHAGQLRGGSLHGDAINPREVMIVEDDADISGIVETNLRLSGYEVTTASDGLQALKLVQRRVPGILVVDRWMPGMDGLRLVQLLRTDPAIPQIPILLLTATTRTADKVDGLAAGADDYLTKPFELPELLARVQALLRRSHDYLHGGSMR